MGSVVTDAFVYAHTLRVIQCNPSLSNCDVLESLDWTGRYVVVGGFKMGATTNEMRWSLEEVGNDGKVTVGFIRQLREKGYPAPYDCLKAGCPYFRPACKLNTCKFAIVICGDW